ncbi:MAG: sulfite exporter TauE/SafE family protein [Planctomycetota bacterium]
MNDFWLALLIVCPAAALGGAINSVAGGGTLVTFPALVWVLDALAGSGSAAILANGTNSVALAPGAFSGSWAYRRELKSLRQQAYWLAIPSLFGGAIGAILVVLGSEVLFRSMIPWLIGAATLLFILQPRLTPAARAVPAQPLSADSSPPQGTTSRPSNAVLIIQLGIAVYGGYFGAGIGILMLSSLSLLNLGNIHQINGLKTVLAGLINGVSVVVFIANDKVYWPLAVPMIVSAMLGGWLGAAWARKLDRRIVRRIVIAIGLVLTAWYFIQEFLIARS